MVIDEAQDFGMMAYCCLHYCLRNCTYTIMGDTSQNIHFEYGLNDWENLKKLILTGTYDAFGLLRKSYRNTVEISGFATEILRHGDFAIYPVEPIIRHGNAVRIEEYANVRSLISASVDTIKGWQSEGYETIAVVCRDEAEALKVSAELKKHIEITDDDIETVQFGAGIMVLPVAYTKGLEFDAVLLFDPSERKYPADDSHVKLLYVAATRALHELAVFHRGRLTPLIADPAPSNRHQKEFSAEPLTKAKEYEKQQLTEKEIEEQKRVDGRRDMDEREYFGPSRIVLKPEQVTNKAENEKLDLSAFVKKDRENQTQCAATDMANKIKIKEVSKAAKKSSLPLNPSPYAYGSIPDNDILHVKGHSKGKFAVKWLKKGKSHVEIATADGTLYVIPITPEIVRVIFVKGIGEKPHKTYWKQKADTAFKWVAKESKSLIEIQTEKLILRIEKKNGAIQYFDADRNLLVSENATEPRLLNNGECYTFFDWDKSEKLKSKGILATDLTDLTNKARYISFGGRQQRLPLVVSNKGYGIATASSRTALFCNIKMYGQYIFVDGDIQSDYYFICGGSVGYTLELYGTL